VSEDEVLCSEEEEGKSVEKCEACVEGRVLKVSGLELGSAEEEEG